MNHLRTTACIGLAIAATAAVMILPGAARAAGTTTLSAQTAYNCQLFTSPPPPDMYNASVTASIQLTAPSSVSPGQTINLSGTLTLQFPESIRAVAVVGGFNTVQGVSTTINLGVDAAGQSTDVFADEWQTPPTQVGNPLQVSGVLTMPPLTVPKNATGTYELQMPENGATDNTVESSPAKVAFTAVATASGPGGTSPIKVACYLPGSSPELGAIPIVAAPAATSTSAGSSSATKAGATTPSATKASTATHAAGATKASGTTRASGVKTTAATTKASATAAPSGTSRAAQATPASGTGVAAGATGATAVTAGSASTGSAQTSAASPSSSAQSATAGDTGVATPEASSATGAVTPSDSAVDDVGSPASSSTPTHSGVYVSTSLLVLGGFLICLASIGYALLTRYRLNSIRRELDD